jgi:hypothetical protein
VTAVALLLGCWSIGVLDAAVDGGVGAGVTNPDAGADAVAVSDAVIDASPDVAAAPVPLPEAPPVVRTALRGRIVSRGIRESLPAATLIVDGTTSLETDEEGRFFTELPVGRHRLQVQAPGFDPAELTVDLPQHVPELTVRLSPRLSGERYETVVRVPDDETGVALAADDLLRTAGSLGEPFRVIESLPGVAQVVWPLSLYAIRGANPGNTGFFIDGVRLPALFHFALGPAVIHPYFLEKMDFYPGGYPARFGRFVSGVVSASTAVPKPDRVRGSADVRLFDAGAIVATPINGGQGTVAVAGRYSYTGLLFSLMSPDYTLSYWDYQARLDHNLGPGRLTIFSFGSSDVLGNKSFSETNAEIAFHRLDVRWQGQAGPGRLLVGNSLGIDASAVSLDPVVKLPIRIKTLSAAPRLSYLMTSERADLELGGDAEIQRLRPKSEREDAAVELFSPRKAVAVGVYTTLTFRATPDLHIIPGFRADQFYEGDAEKLELGPRLALRFRPAGNTWLKAQAGRFAQMASLPVAVPGFESFGLGTIGTQTSKQASVGIEQPLGDALSLDATAFYQRLRLTDLLSVFNYDPQDPRLLELREGESYGVEVMLRRPQNHRVFGWLAYTLSFAQRLVGPSRSRAWSDWDQRHVLNLVTGVRLGRGYSVGGRFHLNTGRPYPVFDDDQPGFPDYVRLPTFYQIDLRADKRFVFDRYVLDLYVEAVNTTLTRQVFDIKRAMGQVDEKAYRIVLPSVGIHAEW